MVICLPVYCGGRACHPHPSVDVVLKLMALCLCCMFLSVSPQLQETNGIIQELCYRKNSRVGSEGSLGGKQHMVVGHGRSSCQLSCSVPCPSAQEGHGSQLLMEFYSSQTRVHRKFAVEEGDHLTMLNVYEAFIKVSSTTLGDPPHTPTL